jgi:hypothetical protein
MEAQYLSNLSSLSLASVRYVQQNHFAAQAPHTAAIPQNPLIHTLFFSLVLEWQRPLCHHVLRSLFYPSLEGNEPPHIHVEQGDKVAKFWLNPINLASSTGFRSHELTEIRALVLEHNEKFREKWDEYFSR